MSPLMRFSLPRPVAAGLVTAVAAAAVVLGAGVANAAVIGTLTFPPPTGVDATPMSVDTSAACPGGTNILGKVYGTGFPTAGYNVVSNTAITALQTNAAGGYVIPLGNTLQYYAAQQSPAATLSGKYDIVVTCRPALGSTTYGDFSGSIWFTTPTTYQSTDPSTPTTVATTTTLAVSPTGPVTAGTAVTLTASVSPAAATGTVQFSDGGTAIGSPVAVSSGTATLTTSALAVGSHSLTAALTGGTGYDSSTSTAVSLSVTAAGATATTTSLAVTPGGSAVEGTSVALNASVSPTAAGGSVKFTDGTATLGTVAVSGGAASFSTSTLSVGSHSLTASFVPADSTAYAPSTSANVTFTVTSAGTVGATGSETLSTTVAAGALTLTVANTAVVLPTPVLNAANDLLSTSGDLNPVTVTDLRAANPGWNVSGQVSDFAGTGTSKISGNNVGWTPNVIDKSTAQTVSAGPAVAAASGVAADSATSSTVGLKTARSLATAANGAGRGTAHVGASLALNVPTDTNPGTYTATLTLTAI